MIKEYLKIINSLGQYYFIICCVSFSLKHFFRSVNYTFIGGYEIYNSLDKF